MRSYGQKYVLLLLLIKYPSFLLVANGTWIFSTDFQKNTKRSKFMKISFVGAVLFRSDGRTGRQTDMKLIVTFRNFANAPKRCIKNFVTETFWKAATWKTRKEMEG